MTEVFPSLHAAGRCPTCRWVQLGPRDMGNWDLFYSNPEQGLAW